MTGHDYAAMSPPRGAQRLRAEGLKNAASTVMTIHESAPNWAFLPRTWFEQLYPGDDKWSTGWRSEPYARTPRVRDFDWPLVLPPPTSPPGQTPWKAPRPAWHASNGWMQWRFPGKPIMVAE
ncbi:hypothetical protein GCM10020219_094280 [Nonomuraea dietziae]